MTQQFKIIQRRFIWEQTALSCNNTAEYRGHSRQGFWD